MSAAGVIAGTIAGEQLTVDPTPNPMSVIPAMALAGGAGAMARRSGTAVSYDPGAATTRRSIERIANDGSQRASHLLLRYDEAWEGYYRALQENALEAEAVDLDQLLTAVFTSASVHTEVQFPQLPATKASDNGGLTG